MLRALLIATLVASSACFSASFGDGELSCEQSLICPPGLVCFEGRCVTQPGSNADAGPDSSAPGFASCAELLASGETDSVVYTIEPGGAPRQVVCDMDTDGGGWTVLVNNDNADAEPGGCVPRVASVAAFECGTPDLSLADHAVLATDIAFTEMLWVAYDDAPSVVAYRLFQWQASQTIPPSDQWSLTPDVNDGTVADFANVELIICDYPPIRPAGLRRIANATVRTDTGNWTAGEIITVFDQDTVAGNTGRMSFAGADPLVDDASGLDDFQDNFGCADSWSPQAARGAASVLMVR